MRLPGLSPFPLDPAHALPVTGEFHPLRREFQRWMSWANALTMLVALLGLCAMLSIKKEPAARPRVIYLPPTCGGLGPVEPVPPTVSVVSETPHVPVQLNQGVPVPVEDWKDLPQIPIPGAVLGGIGDLGTGKAIPPGDPSYIPGDGSLPTPDQLIIAEVYPQLLRMDAPKYPGLAREADIEGTVLLRVLVSKEGKVLNVIVLSGNPMLADAARVAAFTAVFSPAMQQHKPVPVWVQLPVVFSLR